MNRILGKRLSRDLKSKLLHYLALTLLIVIGMYVVVSIVGAAETIIAGSINKAEENQVENGQFEVFLPLTDTQEKELFNTGISLEEMFSMDMEAKDGSVIRLMKNREIINLVDLDEGSFPKNDKELVLEKRYCEEHGLKTGDYIALSGIRFKIVGTGSTPDYDMPTQTFSDMAVESERFGTAFVTPEQYERIRDTVLSGTENYCYAYRLNDSGMTDDDVRQKIRGFDPAKNHLIVFIERSDNPRILAAAGDMQINKKAGLFAGIIIMILSAYVISVFVVHQIQQESSVIGTLYALGVKKQNLLIHYLTLPTVLTLIGGAFGTLLGFSQIGIPSQMAESCHYFSVPALDIRYPAYLIIYSIAMPPAISIMVNYLIINKQISRTAVSLIRNEQKTKPAEKIQPGKMEFIRLFQLRQMIRERRTAFTVVCGMMISLSVLMLGLNCLVLCRNVQKDNIDSIKFKYMYSLRYPGKNVPDGGEACYLESLSKTAMGYTLNISVIGIRNGNCYYDVEPITGKQSLVISRSVSEKYGLLIGDKLTLSDNAGDIDYVFTVKGICDYAGSLAVFMDIDSMRELFGREPDYYNLLLSDKELTLDKKQIYNITTRENALHSASVFTELMMPLTITMTVCAVIIFCMVLYLMMNVMIDRASFGISLLQIFGFRTGEIRKLYLSGNTWVVIAGAIIGIPLAKKIVDSLYPWLTANAAVGMNLRFPWYLYIVIFASTILIYWCINSFLVRKLKQITPKEVLKNRE